MKKKLSMLYILLAGSLWGSMGVYVRKMNAYGLSALEIVQIRITLSLIFVGVYLLLFHREYLKIRLKDLWCFIGTGLVSQLAFSWFDFTGMTITSLSVMSVLLATAPIFVMLLSLILFHEKLTRRKVLALLITFSGCFLVSGIGTAAQAPLKGFCSVWPPALPMRSIPFSAVMPCKRAIPPGPSTSIPTSPARWAAPFCATGS